MAWTADSRARATEKKREKARLWLEAMGIKGTREERAVALAQKHIAEGSRQPRHIREIWPRERYGRIPASKPCQRARYGVSYRLYVAAFQVCLRARELGIRPKHENLDLVDSPDRAPKKSHQRNHNGDSSKDQYDGY